MPSVQKVPATFTGGGNTIYKHNTQIKITSPHYIGCVSTDGGQQCRQNRNDEIDDGLPDLLLIIVHNSIEVICLLSV